MIKIAIAYLFALIFLSIGLKCYGGSITYGNTIDVSGGLKLTDSCLHFPNGSSMCTAESNAVWGSITGDINQQTDLMTVLSNLITGEATWGMISGEIANQIDLSEKFTTKEDIANKNIPSGYAGLDSSGKLSFSQVPSINTFYNHPVLDFSPTWLQNQDTWVNMDMGILFSNNHGASPLLITYSDNIGIYDNSTCNIGIFIGDDLNPVCGASWSGVTGSMIFNQQTVSCAVPVASSPALMSGAPVAITIKHRSQYCIYGNYYLDEFGAVRSLRVQLL